MCSPAANRSLHCRRARRNCCHARRIVPSRSRCKRTWAENSTPNRTSTRAPGGRGSLRRMKPCTRRLAGTSPMRIVRLCCTERRTLRRAPRKRSPDTWSRPRKPRHNVRNCSRQWPYRRTCRRMLSRPPHTTGSRRRQTRRRLASRPQHLSFHMPKAQAPPAQRFRQVELDCHLSPSLSSYNPALHASLMRCVVSHTPRAVATSLCRNVCDSGPNARRTYSHCERNAGVTWSG